MGFAQQLVLGLGAAVLDRVHQRPDAPGALHVPVDHQVEIVQLRGRRRPDPAQQRMSVGRPAEERGDSQAERRRFQQGG